MKYLPLIWAGLWRKPIRTVLTTLSIVVAFLLFGVLHGVSVSFDNAKNKMSDVRLRVISRANMFEPLPVSYRERIARVPGVTSVSQFNIMVGWYQDPKNFIAVPGLDLSDASSMRSSFPEIHVPPEQLVAMTHTRDGALAGATLLADRGWKLGDRIPVHTSVAKKDGSDVWTFQIVGVVNGGPGDDRTFANELWANYQYIDEARAAGGALANQFIVKIDDPAHAGAIGAAIDKQFANSPYETRTMSEKDYLENQLKQIGDVGLFVNAVLGAVMFTLLFLTGNTMMQSVRDRIPELGVLKAMGFERGAIVGMVIAEAALLSVFAAVVGLTVAAVAFPVLFKGQGIPITSMPWQVYANGFVVALLLALCIALLPARRAMRLTIVDALAGR